MYSDVLIKIKYVCYLPRIVDDPFLIPIQSRPSSMLHQYPQKVVSARSPLLILGGGGLNTPGNAYDYIGFKVFFNPTF